MRRTWWVALLFLLPSLLLTLLIHSALFLRRGLDSPSVWVGALFLPFVATGRDPKRAFARGLYVLAALGVVFAAVVYLRLWTGAGAAVLEREGLLSLSPWGLALAALAAGGGFLVSRRTTTRS